MIERMTLEARTKSERRGSWFGLIAMMAGLSLAGYFIANGRPVWGLIALLTPLSVIASLFLVKRSRKRGEIGENESGEPQASPPVHPPGS